MTRDRTEKSLDRIATALETILARIDGQSAAAEAAAASLATTGKAMTLAVASTILAHQEAIDGQRLQTAPEGAGRWVFWEPWCGAAKLGGYWYTAEELEAIAVWMRHYHNPASPA